MADKSRQPESRAQVQRPRSLPAMPRPLPEPEAPRAQRWQDAVAVIAVRGELDREALWAIDFTVGRASAEAGRVVLDLLEVTHLDYTGVGELVARRRELLARGGELAIAVKNPYVTNILKAAGGAELWLCRSVDEASGAVQVAVAGRRAAAGARKKGP